MKKYCLIGHNISYSLSPLIHNLILKSKDIEGSYSLCDIEKNELELLFKNFGYNGANVTIPYKDDVIHCCDFISDEAKQIGAVNTIMITDDCICGYNTDIYGFIKLLDINKINVKDKNAFILGSGGAQCAIKFALLKCGVKSVTVVSRKKLGSGIISYDEIDKVNNIDILINATPLGSGKYADICPVKDNVLSKCNIIMDLNYSPKESILIKKGKQRGKVCINGVDMLIWQAIISEMIFGNIRADDDLFSLIKKETDKELK